MIRELGEKDHFWQMSFGKRPPVELFDLSKDPDCVNNLATDEAYTKKVTALHEKLFAELKKQEDPRVLGKGDVFDNCVSPQAKMAKPKKTK